MNKIVLALSLMIGLAACGGSSLGDCPADSTATQTAGRTLIKNRCANCHSSTASGAARQGAPTDVNYDTLAGIQLNVENGWAEVSSGSMPENGTLTAAEIENIRVYLACGAADVPVN